MILSGTDMRVLQIVEENYGLDHASLDFKLRELGDSLELANLILELENEFGLDIPDEESQRIHTLREVVSYIEAHR